MSGVPNDPFLKLLVKFSWINFGRCNLGKEGLHCINVHIQDNKRILLLEYMYAKIRAVRDLWSTAGRIGLV